MAGTETLGRCLAELDLVSCRQETPIGPFPVSYYLPDLVADSGAGLSEAGRVRVLAVLSGVGLLVAVGSAWLVLRRLGHPEWRWGFLLVAVSGPALAYGSSTWGEMPSTGLVTLFVAAALLPAHPVLLALAAFGATLTKETSYPFVAALGLVALYLAHRRTGSSVRRHAAFGAAGIAAALAVSSAFNLLRFGTPKNAYYLDPALRTDTPERMLELAAGLFVSPNGGIVLFWPLAALLVSLLLAVPALRAVRGALPLAEAWPALALIATLGTLTLGLAAWWSPFGWWAWGPRLSLPWVLPIVLLALAAYAPLVTPIVTAVLARVPTSAAVAVAAVVAALPHVGLLWRPEVVGRFFFEPESSVCPGGGPPPSPAYYECLHEEMWTRHPIWLDALSGLTTSGGAATAVAVASAVGGCVVLLRRETLARAGELDKGPASDFPEVVLADGPPLIPEVEPRPPGLAS